MLINEQNLLRSISDMFKKVIVPLAGIGIIGLTSLIPTVVKAHENHQMVSQSEGQDQDIEYLTILGLMKGHLIVAKELLALGKPEKAEPHIGHPVEELYAVLEPHLQERKIPEFKSSLTKLHDLVKGKPNSPELDKSYQEVMKAIDQAMKANQNQSSEVVFAVIQELLLTAKDEYSAAIANGKIVEELEYQDSRGFVLYAEMLYKTIAGQVSPSVGVTIAELKKAWPSVLPPTQPVKTPAQVSDLVGQLSL
jgi:hypothetical protein